VLIGKMKKNYEDLQKKVELLNTKYGECRNRLDQFEEMFVDTPDIERLNEIKLVDEAL
jgi:hypothetical protein